MRTQGGVTLTVAWCIGERTWHPGRLGYCSSRKEEGVLWSRDWSPSLTWTSGLSCYWTCQDSHASATPVSHGTVLATLKQRQPSFPSPPSDASVSCLLHPEIVRTHFQRP